MVDRAQSAVEQRGSVVGLATLSYLRAWPDFFAGPIAEAAADAESALDARRFGWQLYAVAAATVLAHARLEQGDIAGAENALAQVDPPGKGPVGTESAMLLNARARVHLARGNPAGALRDLLVTGHLLSEAGVATRPIPWRSEAALAARATGDDRQARQLAAAQLVVARRSGTGRHVGMALRTQGLVVGGRQGEALLAEAVNALEHSESRLERVRALIDWGAALRRAGRRPEARKALEEGNDLAHRFGACVLAGKATASCGPSGCGRAAHRRWGPVP